MLLFFLLLASFKLDFLCSKDIEQDAQSDDVPFGSHDPNSYKKLVMTSKPVKLNCAKPGWNSTGTDIIWFYKSCAGPICNLNDMQSDGHKICGFPNKQVCSVKLYLEKPLPGLYKCYKMEKKLGYVTSATPVILYNLQVLERSLEPEFLELPEDVETFLGANVLFTCRIKSSLPLHVKWYKRVPKSPGAFQYEHKYYQLLNTTEISKVKDVFLSKLKLKRITKDDTGIYACGAVNEAGIRYKEANLSIFDFEDDFEKPESPLGSHWKIILFASAVVFLVMAVKCVVCLHFIRSSSSRKPPRVRRQRQFNIEDKTDPETSDYEHVINL